MNVKTVQELELELGQNLRTIRLRQTLDQQTLASRAGISLNAVKNLENGKGSTLSSLLNVLRILNKTDWLSSLAPTVSVSPLDALKLKTPRQRVFKARGKRNV